jgi:hypothetical protein
MLNRIPALLACGALLMATAVPAQAAPDSAPASQAAPGPASPSAPSSVSPLTVQAAPGPATVQKQARDFVQLFTAPSPALDQFARWHRAICVSVAGLPDDQAKRVSSRIQEVANGVGMHALPAGCHANVEVVFTDRPQAFMDNVAKTHEEVLGYYHRHDRDRLKAMTRPVQAWYQTATDSGAMAANSALAFATITTQGGASTGVTIHFQGKAEVDDDPENPVPSGCSDAPQFTHCMMSELTNALIVVDTGHLRKGQTLGPITDYLSMLALAQIKSLDGCAALPSVIDLLGKPCVGRELPDGLTPADAAYLTSLYASDLEANKPLEQDEIASRMGSIFLRSRAAR